MLRNVLDLVQQSGGVPLSLDTISDHLNVSREVVDQLVRTLVQRGKLVEVDGGCISCSSCPLKIVCTGAPHISTHGYTLAERDSTTIPQIG